MPVLQKLNVGLVGVGGRGGHFGPALAAAGARIHAVCDTRPDALENRREKLGAAEAYTDYAAMLDRSELDAVVIGTPQHLHARQAILALTRGLHVLSEVPAGVALEECRDLVQVCARSKVVYMMAENYCYFKHNVLVRELARRGLFGTVYYAEGAYLHDIRDLAPQTPWRRKWQLGIDGITYPTHSLGPVLQWMYGDRIARVACAGSGYHHRDAAAEPFAQDTSVMLAQTAKDALVKIRMDLISPRPHATGVYELQGTDGVFETGKGAPARIWLRQLSEEVRWHDVETLLAPGGALEAYLPESWRNPPPEALQAGHGGGDFFEILDWVRAIRGEAPCPIGIHEAMDMTLPGLVSQESIAQNGVWRAVPDSRDWIKGGSA